MNLRDIFTLMAKSQHSGYLVKASQEPNRRKRRAEPKRDRLSTRKELTSRQREARERKEKHRRRIAKESRRRNRRLH